MKKFSLNELKEFDGTTPGKPVYFAYRGKVYDATANALFIEGMHFEHPTGCDLTDYIADAPHGEEVLEELPVVGEYDG
ncbi:MAG TPA: cytochrome b5 domain-containing protein [Thermodesulfobacteriota bacterium]|nr:cytochrome b5 domain-containing protein [Thermodesulfobacteriota bacterium]